MATVEKKFNPFTMAGIDPPRDTSTRKAALEEIADWVLEQVLSKVASQTSPVSGHDKFKSLKKSYAKFKRSQGGRAIPNLELDGDMLDALKTNIRGNQITIGITGREGEKAMGHNQHRGDPKPKYLPVRRFIPDEKESFKKDIIDGIKRIVGELESGD